MFVQASELAHAYTQARRHAHTCSEPFATSMTIVNGIVHNDSYSAWMLCSPESMVSGAQSWLTLAGMSVFCVNASNAAGDSCDVLLPRERSCKVEAKSSAIKAAGSSPLM